MAAKKLTIQRNRKDGVINFLVRRGAQTVARLPTFEEAEAHVAELKATDDAAEAPPAEKKAPAKKAARKRAPRKKAPKK